VSAHPFIPAGFNAAPFAGEPLNGGGINDPSFPFLVTDAILPTPLVSQPNMWDEVDYHVRGERRDFIVTFERRTFKVRG